MRTNIKMRVTPEQSKKVQEIVVANGGRWMDDYRRPEYIGLRITKQKCLHEITNDSWEFWNSTEEVDADLFIRTNGTCEKEPISNCPECGSGDVEYCQISKRFYCNECKYWQAINYGTKADAIRKWNKLSQKEEPHAELKRKHNEKKSQTLRKAIR